MLVLVHGSGGNWSLRMAAILVDGVVGVRGGG